MNRVLKDYVTSSINIADQLDHDRNEFVIGAAGDSDSMDIWYSGSKPLMILGITRLIEEAQSALGQESELTFGQILSLIIDEHEEEFLEPLCEEEISDEEDTVFMA